MGKYVCILQNTITWLALYKTDPQVKLQYCLANIGSNSHIGNSKIWKVPYQSGGIYMFE